MKFVNYAIVRFSLFLTLGILAAFHFPLHSFMGMYIIFALLIVAIFGFFAKRHFTQKVYFGISVYVFFFLLGFASYQLRQPDFQKNHYSHYVATEENQLIQLKIIESLKPDLYSNKYYATVLSIDKQAAGGKIILSIKKESVSELLSPDRTILVYGKFSKFQKPLNPGQFDYGGYLYHQEVHAQIKTEERFMIHSQKGKPTLYGSAQNFRQYLVDCLQKTSISQQERSIIQALILGDKREIDKQLYDEYAAAGAVHILAVSGLHVGILFLILSFISRPLRNFKYGSVLQSVTIVLLLWGFAFLAGLSPSVVRSVSMFSFFAFALLIGRRTNGLNTLFLSYFFLLLFNPFWLFQVGFQLSYAAVFFILWTQPIFNRLGYSKHYIIRKSSGLITVSLSAQIGVLPLTLFYFNQFPGLFLVTNLVVLPVLTVFMVGGILVVGLASFHILPDRLALAYNFMIEKLNAFIGWISQQESFIFSDISFSKSKAVATYILIIATILWLHKKRFSRLVFVLVSILLFFSVSIYDKSASSHSELWIFHANRSSLIGYKNAQNLLLLHKDSTRLSHHEFPVKTYKTKRNIRKTAYNPLPEVFRYNRQTILVLDSLGTLPKNGNIDVLLLTNSPKINLRRVIDSLQPKQIIADGSNYPSFVQQWRKQSENSGAAFHYTGEDGAFLVK